ncbi:hypothetical protein FXF51_05560 [Nonomuraea sp. PA05]|uniref:hypothetical protein n=1 Tax=Nonomuraea sp. PA05 TaxID=2604466 RepID=UPI0011D91814|nr:hypothetical protein [Nonomuraea sp. PA05]TYB69631.1 hypothetical protein FXF51_05560 [Nonomuraea sp. PA05]
MMIDRPPGWRFLTTVSVVALISFYGASVSKWYSEAIMFMFLAWSVLILIWLTRLGTAGWQARHVLTTARLRRWLPAPLIFFAVVAALAMDGPLWVRFSLSQPSLERYAKEIAAGVDPSPGCRWVGLYRICGDYTSGGEAIPGGSRFLVSDWPLMASRGFVWLPSGQLPTDNMDDQYRHLTGPWYGWKGWDGV